MSNRPPDTIVKTTAADNVGIVSNQWGLTKGVVVAEGITVIEDIPMGHKVALADMPTGTPVIRYGQIIGYTNTDISRGSWLNETNIEMPQPPDLKDIPYKQNK